MNILLSMRSKMMKKKINGEIFNKYFGCKNPSFLAKDLIKTDQSKINEMVSPVQS